jgi:hypothetical protein
MPVLDFLAERKIAEAIARGELDDLPGRGLPLALDDDLLIPEDLRIAYRILKNAGFVPREVTTLREITELENLIQDGCGDCAARAKAVKKLALLGTRIEAGYYEKALNRLGR